MTIVMRPSCWHQKFGPNWLSAPILGLCLNFFSPVTSNFNISPALRWAIQDQWSSGYDCTANKWRNDLIMSSKLLSKLLCKNNTANSTQQWGRSTTATAKKGNLVVSGPQTSKEKPQTRKFRMVGCCNVFLVTDKKTRVSGVDTGSVGLVETRVFFNA